MLVAALSISDGMLEKHDVGMEKTRCTSTSPVTTNHDPVHVESGKYKRPLSLSRFRHPNNSTHALCCVVKNRIGENV